MRAPNEIHISFEVIESFCRKGNIMAAETIEGLAPDARLVGARVKWAVGPTDTSPTDLGVLVLEYDRPVPQVMFRDLRSFEGRVGDAAESAAIQRLGDPVTP